jgi:hypothetical protein
VFDEEISTSKPLLGHGTSILGAWVNHVIIHTNLTLYYQKNLFTSKLDLNLRKKLVKCYVWSMALYGAETAVNRSETPGKF